MPHYIRFYDFRHWYAVDSMSLFSGFRIIFLFSLKTLFLEGHYILFKVIFIS
jgi:hypothetical protein